MNENPPEYMPDSGLTFRAEPEVILAQLVPEPPRIRPPRRPPGWLRRHLPVLLFVATCLSTLLAGSHLLEILASCTLHGWSRVDFDSLWPVLVEHMYHGLIYGSCIMTILLCHEMGHYFQARRYRVPASLPFFIPMPIGPIGTLGAVIGMRPGVGDRKAIFDIGITGPLAGLVPTLIFCVVGLQLSEVGPLAGAKEQYGDPLLIQFLVWLQYGPLPSGYVVMVHPMAFAAWVGLLITSLNLIPIGQLDGGHVLYALLRKKAHHVASFLLMAATVAVVVAAVYFHYPVWVLMVLLLFIMGPNHPPTANDDVPLGAWRIVLGWLTLAFVLIGFTPVPFKI
ncbi:MAG: site-2 protease family protein [Pirellulales bacterium]|nr:site-2 protease family protein [Pirellulales bacterium]